MNKIILSKRKGLTVIGLVAVLAIIAVIIAAIGHLYLNHLRLNGELVGDSLIGCLF